jgi:hypothetical protein
MCFAGRYRYLTESGCGVPTRDMGAFEVRIARD